MAIDAEAAGKLSLDPITVQVERGRLRFFAKATGRKVGVNTDLLSAMERVIPLGRAGTPAEAAGAVYLLCVPESDYVSGQTLVCGGGFAM